MIYTWCPTLPFLPNQFLYDCKLDFHSCKNLSPASTASPADVEPHVAAPDGREDLAAQPASGPGLEGTLHGMLVGAIIGSTVAVGGLLLWRCGHSRLHVLRRFPERRKAELVGVFHTMDSAE